MSWRAFFFPFFKRYTLRLAESQLPESTDLQEPSTQRSCQEGWFLGPDMNVWTLQPHTHRLQAMCHQYTKTSDGWLGIVRFPVKARNLSLFQNVETCSWFQADSYPMDMRADFQGVKRPRHWDNHWRHLVLAYSLHGAESFLSSWLACS